MQVNPLTREVLVKIVYYGPGLGGKTTSLQCVHRSAPPETRGQIVSLATPVDRTLYFDFLPIRLPPVRDHHVRLQLFTVPGQVYFNATRKLVLTGADGVVFVADSQRARHDANLESMENLIANLRDQGRGLSDVPLVLQYNKRDLDDILELEQLDGALNTDGAPSFGTCATGGDGVLDALDELVRAVLTDLEDRQVLGTRHKEAPPLKLARTDDALEEQIGRASEQIWRTTLERAQEARDSVPPERVASAPPPAPTPEEAGAPSAAVQELVASAGRRAVRHSRQEEGFPAPASERPPPPGPALRRSSAMAPAVTIPSPGRSTGVPRGPTWSILFDEQREAVRELERELTGGRLSAAVVRCEQVALRLLSDTATRTGLDATGRDPSVVAMLLGVDGARWLSFRRLVRRVRDGGPVAERDALAAYALLIDLALRAHRVLT